MVLCNEEFSIGGVEEISILRVELSCDFAVFLKIFLRRWVFVPPFSYITSPVGGFVCRHPRQADTLSGPGGNVLLVGYDFKKTCYSPASFSFTF